MFHNNNMGVMNFAFPDVCQIITPAGTVPIPFPNIALSFTHIPTQFTVLIGVGLGENLLTSGTISNGDEAGVALGVASGLIIGPDRSITCSVRVFCGGIPSTHLTSVCIQNSTNAIGISITPAQIRVLVLS